MDRIGFPPFPRSQSAEKPLGFAFGECRRFSSNQMAKKKHHSHRLFGPLFLNALWKRLEVGGKLEFATDHKEYFETVCECFAGDSRFERVEAMPRPKEVWTEFETMFRSQGLPVYSAAWRSLEADDSPLEPLKIPPEAEPREGIARRCCRFCHNEG